MIRIFSIMALLTCLPLSQVGAQMPGSWTSNLTLTSDYVFRGLSQSDEHPALQGSLDWGWDAAGVYAGAWASTVDHEDASLELDLYAGLNGMRGNMTWDLGAIYYLYPGADESYDYDFWELAVAGGYDFSLFALSAALNISPDYFGEADESVYPAAYVSVPLPYGLSASGSLGYLWEAGGDDHADWSLGLNGSVYGLEAGVAYKDTSLDSEKNGRLVFSLGRSF